MSLKSKPSAGADSGKILKPPNGFYADPYKTPRWKDDLPAVHAIQDQPHMPTARFAECNNSERIKLN